MDIRQLHPWEVSLEEARDIQSHLASQVSQLDTISERPRYVAGTDISPPDANGVAWGAAVVMSLPDLPSDIARAFDSRARGVRGRGDGSGRGMACAVMVRDDEAGACKDDSGSDAFPQALF